MLLSEEILIAAAVLMVIALAILSLLRKNRESKYRDAVRKLELVLQPRETIKMICPQKKGRVILTSKRVQGNNEKGNRTTSVPKMVSLTIKADQDYEIKGGCPEFAEFSKQLMKKTAPRKPKKEKNK